jgi:hypothetical protein
MKRYLIIFQLLMFVLVAPVQAQTQKKNFRKDFEDFKTRLPHMKQIYDRMGVNYCHQVE